MNGSLTGFRRPAIKWRTHASLRELFCAKKHLSGCSHVSVRLIRRDRSDSSWRSYLDIVLQIEGYQLTAGDFK